MYPVIARKYNLIDEDYDGKFENKKILGISDWKNTIEDDTQIVKKIKDVLNPKTGDTIQYYCIISLIGLSIYLIMKRLNTKYGRKITRIQF